MLGSLFGGNRKVKPKRFHIEPRYHDPEKEDLERRVAMAKTQRKRDLEEGIEIEESDETLEKRVKTKYRMEERFFDSVMDRDSFARVQHQKNKSNMRLLIILNILIILTAFLVFKFLV